MPLHRSASLHLEELPSLQLDSETRQLEQSDSPPFTPASPTDLISTSPIMKEKKKKYDFWQCGHITRIKDGETVSEDANLDPLLFVRRGSIRPKFGDACPRCYTDRAVQRLQSIGELLLDCGQHEAVRMAAGRVMALTEYLERTPAIETLPVEGSLVNYPEEFRDMMRHVVELGIEVYTSATEDFAAAHRRLRSRVSDKFVDRINAIRDNAQLYFTTGGTPVARECMVRIVTETSEMVNQLREYEEGELKLLSHLDIMAGELKKLVDAYLESNKQHAEALKHPEF
ncbi:hypothetical protein FHL15_007170 [Xylaria flabelliformis]|uniref:Uncharacterized protein n=1 Tax=Xylaria flabelliformis TaxID=2512241 RepID=A0A553HV70_9PEZI|nr:hypothetical protein FHL15_007170 [Xylaria flabelliformis]